MNTHREPASPHHRIRAGHPARSPERALLRRSFTGPHAGRVAAGLARYFGVDTTIVRIAFVVLTLFGGAGIPLYLAGLLLIPDEGSDQSIAGSLIDSLQSRPAKEATCHRSVITPSPAIPGLASPGPAASRRCSAACTPTSTCASRTPSARPSTDRLAEHFADGRLDQAEFDERVSRAMNAKTRADLSGLFADLPETHQGPRQCPERRAPQAPPPGSRPAAPGRHRRGRRARRSGRHRALAVARPGRRDRVPRHPGHQASPRQPGPLSPRSPGASPAPPGPSPASLHSMGQRTEPAEIRGSQPVDRHTHHTLRLFTFFGPPARPRPGPGPEPGPDRKAEEPVWLFSRAASAGTVPVHPPVLGGGGMADPEARCMAAAG